MNEALVLCELVAGAVEVGRGAVSLSQHPALHRLHVHRLAAEKKIKSDENRDSPERDMVNPSTDSYMWPIRDTH